MARLMRNIAFGLAILWVLLGSLQYGYHISALNSAQVAISCAAPIGREGHPIPKSTFGLPSCIRMSDNDFGVLTASYTLGGLFSSFYAGKMADFIGRKKSMMSTAILVGLGSAIMALSAGFYLLVLGRFIVGLACGLSTVLVPLYLSELAPPSIRGSIGVLNQVAICLGIFAAQAISIPFTRDESTGDWRWITVVSGASALFMIITVPFMHESPKFLMERGLMPIRLLETPSVSVEPRGNPFDSGISTDLDSDVETPLMSGVSLTGYDRQLTIPQVLFSPDAEVKHGLRSVLVAMTFQQVSGINAVMYYSTSILSTVLPVSAKLVALAIAGINVVMTFPPIFLIDRLGSKVLLLTSLTCMSLCSLALAYAINYNLATFSAVAILAFVAAFSIGLGPVPFTLLGDVPPPQATSATASLGLGLNWLANFLVGLFFLPVRDKLSWGDKFPGNVFYLFSGLSAVGFISAWLVLRSPPAQQKARLV